MAKMTRNQMLLIDSAKYILLFKIFPKSDAFCSVQVKYMAMYIGNISTPH